MEYESMELSNSLPSEKKKSLAAVLALLLGFVGAHRFYVGKTTSAFIQLFTMGGCFLWALADLIIIMFGEFEDSEGRKLK